MRRARIAMTTLGLATLLLVLPGRAGADMGPHISSGWYLPVGLNLGAGLHPDLHHGFQIGGEVSFAYLDARKFIWGGGYVDVLRDLGAKSTRFSIGPEFGWSFIGIDAGYMGDIRDGDYHHGMTIRLLLTISIVSIYGRWGHVFGLDEESDFGEVGVLLKAPIPLKVKSDGPTWPPPPDPATDADEPMPVEEASGQTGD